MRSHRRARGWLLGPLAVVVIAGVATTRADAADPVPGSQGTDTSLPPTSSQVTVKGRDAFANLTITVNQTQQLTTQAVSITWTGGVPTTSGPGDFAAHFLQIFQCWGDEDPASPADNPGPSPEKCQQGAVAGQPGGVTGTAYPNGFSLYRIITKSGLPNYDPSIGVLDSRTGNVWLPFRAVNGTVVDIPDDPTFNPAVGGGNYWLNPFFNSITTNEIVAARTGPNGRGAELFQVNNGLDAPGLGCGQRTEPDGGGGKKIPKCWIVVVPRGTPSAENAGLGNFEENADSFGVYSSPVSPNAWRNRIAIPIGFTPVDSPCTLSAVERRIAGSEMVESAVSSWQPALCADATLAPYSYATVGDAAARQQLSGSKPGSPGMVVVSRPLTPAQIDPASPTFYAPLTASGVVIGFNIERNPRTDAPAAEQQLQGVRVAELNLTPRLVAKLLTQSYRSQVMVGNASPGYPWSTSNPTTMLVDPDFLRFNPEFALLQSGGRLVGGLQLPAGNSDAAQQVWEWILADPEALAWLGGAADEWGMKVNPRYSTDAALNPTGVPFGDPMPSSFPKSDPFCYQAPPRGFNNTIVPPPLCGTDWMPYGRNFADGARNTRAGNDVAKVVQNPFAIVSSDVWKRDPPQPPGSRLMITITDTPSAARFGLQTARLSRAGDNGIGRVFVAADTKGLTAGVESMRAGLEPQVLEPAPTVVAPKAYPLTVLTYAAIKPLSLDQPARDAYAAFVEYAADGGQQAGFDLGQLPPGYAPLSLELRVQGLVVAEITRSLVAEEPPASTTTVPPATTTTIPISAEETTTTTDPGAPPNAAPSTPAALPSNAPTNAFPSAPRPSSNPSGGNSITDPSTTTTATDPPPTEPSSTPTSAIDEVEERVVDPADEPVASGPPVITQALALANSRFAVPGLSAVALGSALGALEITKRPRRGRSALPAEVTLLDDAGDE